jgi:integrase
MMLCKGTASGQQPTAHFWSGKCSRSWAEFARRPAALQRVPSAARRHRHDHLAGLRDRALIALVGYSFARVGAATGMWVEDAFTHHRRPWVRLVEKGGKQHEMPCHHNLEAYLHAWLDTSGLRLEPKAPLFPTVAAGKGRGQQRLTRRHHPREAQAMVRKRAKGAGIATVIGNHTFRGTGITAYLKNGGTLEKAREMANHADTRTTRLYDRRAEDVSLDDVERISI